MSRIAPPVFARWMLAHMMPGEANDALAGDLHEEFCAGRSAAWYWHQTLSAIAIRWVREFRMHCAALLFAVFWCMLAPVWMLAFAGLARSIKLSEHLAQLTWPWSITCDLGLTLAASLLFIWTGILLYLLPDQWLAGNLRLPELVHGIAASLPVLLVLWLALIVLPRHFIAVHTAAQTSAFHTPTPLEAYRIDLRRRVAAYGGHNKIMQNDQAGGEGSLQPGFGPCDAIADMHTPAMLVRLLFFFAVVCTLWQGAERTRRNVS